MTNRMVYDVNACEIDRAFPSPHLTIPKHSVRLALIALLARGFFVARRRRCATRQDWFSFDQLGLLHPGTNSC
jgi:hypothetical protein